MVSQCLEVIRLQGQYYTFVHQTYGDERYSDRFVPKVQGTQPLGYLRWLQSTIRHYTDFQLHRTIAMSGDDFMKNLERGIYLARCEPDGLASHTTSSQDDPVYLSDTPSSLPPTESVWGRDVFITNLDDGIFSVNYCANFDLNSIPINWRDCSDTREFSRCSQITLGLYMRECLKNSLGIRSIPRFCSPYPAPPKTFSNVTFILVRPKPLESFPTGKKAAICFNYRLFQKFTEIEFASPCPTTTSSQFVNWNYLSILTNEAVAVRESIYALLCLASNSPKYVNFYKVGGFARSISSGSSMPLLDCVDAVDSAFVRTERENIQDPEEIAGSVAFSTRLSPDSTTYWFENVLICLRNDLDQETQAENYIDAIVQYEKLQGRFKFYGLLVSIRFVLVFQVMGGGKIYRTSLMPFVHLDRPLFGRELQDDGNIPSTAFVGIVQLLEAAHKNESIQVYRWRDHDQIPEEILENIFNFTHPDTLKNVAKCSLKLRRICQRTCSFTDEFLLTSDQSNSFLTLQHNTTKDVVRIKFEQQQPRIRLNTTWAPVVGCNDRKRTLLLRAAFNCSDPCGLLNSNMASTDSHDF